MNDTCQLIKDLHARMARGENPDDIFPLHLNGFNKDQLIEILSWGIKYMHDVDRVTKCKNLLKEVQNYD